MASSFVRAQIPVRGKGSDKCPRHSKKEVIFSCLDCKEELVCVECVTSVHQGHNFSKLSDVVEQKRKHIEKFIETTEIVTLPSIQSEINLVGDEIKHISKSMSQVVHDIKTRAEYLKNKIEDIMKSLIETCRILEMENEENLEKYRAKLCTLDLDLRTTLTDCKRGMRSSNVAGIFDIGRGLQSIPVPPRHPDLQLVNFNEGWFVESEFSNGFGMLSIKEAKYLNDNDTAKTNSAKLRYFEELVNAISENIRVITEKKREKEESKTYESANLAGNPKVNMMSPLKTFPENFIVKTREIFNDLRTLVNQAPTEDAKQIWHVKVESLAEAFNEAIQDFGMGDDIMPPTDSQNSDSGWCIIPKKSEKTTNDSTGTKKPIFFTSSVATFRKSTLDIISLFPATEDSAWVVPLGEQHATLYSKHGEARENLKCDSQITDIGISPVTGNLWICCKDKRIREQATYLYVYSSLEVRFETDFIPLRFYVKGDSTIVIAGDKTLRIFKTDGEQLHSIIKDESGMFAVIHPQGLTVCPLTGKIAACNKDAKPHVVVLNNSLHLLFRYYGKEKYNRGQQTLFNPTDVTFDTKGRLLVASHDSKSIFILDHAGETLGTIHADLVRPVTIDFHLSGILWVGFDNGMVKSLKVIEKC